jgi:hypothetical protein
MSTACDDPELDPRFVIPKAGREIKAAISCGPPD